MQRSRVQLQIGLKGEAPCRLSRRGEGEEASRHSAQDSHMYVAPCLWHVHANRLANPHG